MEKFCLDCQSTKKCERFKTRIKTSWRECGRRRLGAEVWGACEKAPLPRGTRRRRGVDIVARAHALSPGRMRTLSPRHRRRRPSAEVWGVCEKTPSLAALVVARAQTLLPACMRSRPGTGVTARAGTLCPGTDRSGRPTTPVCDRRRCRLHWPCVRPNFRGYNRSSFPFSPHFPSIRSFLAWTCPPAAPYENLTDRTLAFFSYCVICLCEPHKRTVHHLHILDYERP